MAYPKMAKMLSAWNICDTLGAHHSSFPFAHNKWNVRTMHNKNTLNLPILGNLEILPKGIVFMVRSIWKLNVSQRQHQNAHATLLLRQSTWHWTKVLPRSFSIQAQTWRLLSLYIGTDTYVCLCMPKKPKLRTQTILVGAEAGTHCVLKAYAQCLSYVDFSDKIYTIETFCLHFCSPLFVLHVVVHLCCSSFSSLFF